MTNKILSNLTITALVVTFASLVTHFVWSPFQKPFLAYIVALSLSLLIVGLLSFAQPLQVPIISEFIILGIVIVSLFTLYIFNIQVKPTFSVTEVIPSIELPIAFGNWPTFLVLSAVQGVIGLVATLAFLFITKRAGLGIKI